PKPPRDWNQPHGNAANSAACDVEPVRGPPNEAWRTKFDAILAGPVVSGDRLFVAVREGRERRLLALQPATGAVVATNSLDRGAENLELAAEDSFVAVLEPQRVKTYRLTGD